MEALDFLTLVWGSKMGWVDIPSKVAGHWVPFSASWPEDKPLIRRRIESCLEDDEDVYFSVCQFTDEGRRLSDTLSTHWLWADLDRVDPADCAEFGLAPTICWESSPWRYQALWRVDRVMRPQVLAQINRALSYTLGADRGGWDLTQVLRPVGTRNQKYPGSPEVLLVYDGGPEYEAKELWRAVRGASDSRPARAARQSISAGARGQREGMARIPARARALLATPAERVVTGERSDRLWELNCLLAEAGLEGDEIVALVADSAWNKWGSATKRLERDVERALAHVEKKSGGSTASGTLRHTGNGGRPKHEAARTLVDKVTPAEQAELEEFDLSEPSEEAEERELHLPFMGYSSFMAANLEAPRWLIQDLWMAQSHGVIGGDPKSSKSLIAMAMGLSIASGQPFLGDERFSVNGAGPVLMVQEENSPWDVQDKLRKLAMLYGLIDSEDVERSRAPEGSVAGQVIRLGFPTDAPLMLLNNFGYDMSEEEHREALEESIVEHKPAMVILDPLYLMLGSADADKSTDVRPFQQWLLHLRYEYSCAVVVVHHFGKPRADDTRRHGHRLLGSGTWYNWVDSALYCAAMDPEKGKNRNLKIEREWRSSPPAPALQVRMGMGGPGRLKLDVEIESYSLGDTLLAIVEEDPGITLVQAAESLNVTKQTARKYAVGSGKIRMEGGKRGRGHSWRLYPVAAGEDDGETEG